MKANRLIQLVIIGMAIIAIAVPVSASVPILPSHENETVARPQQQGDLARRRADGALVMITGGQVGPAGNWQIETLSYGSEGKKIIGFSSIEELRLVAGQSNLGAYALPPNFKVGYGWLSFADSYYPTYLVRPLREVYLRVAGLLGEPEYETVVERNKLGNGEFGAFNFGADWGTIWVNEGLFLPGLSAVGKNTVYLDELTHEFGHQRLAGWDGMSHQGLAEALVWATRGETEPAYFRIYEDLRRSPAVNWNLDKGRQEMVTAAGAFYALQKKYPGFLPYWAAKTDELRAKSRDEYKTPYLTEGLAKQWAEEYKRGLWQEIQLAFKN